MATDKSGQVIQSLRKMVLLRDGAGLTDRQLIEEYLSHGEDAALGALVRRHGSMVWSLCYRILHNHHDAEDAIQTTFLVLVRKAASVPKDAVGNWLYGVAYQTALNTRATVIRRTKKERQMTDMPEPEAQQCDLWHEMLPILDRELSRLPTKYRTAIVLCDLEGKTRKEAARQTGLPEGTIASHLARGRSLLARRLARRGLAASGATLVAVMSQKMASAHAPPMVVSSTIKAVSLFANGKVAAGMISANVLALTEGMLKTMLLSKLKITAVLVLVTCIASYGVGVIGRAALAEGQNGQTQGQAVGPKSASKNQPNVLKEKTDEEHLQGTWKLVETKFSGISSAGQFPQLVFSAKKLEYQYAAWFWDGSYKLGKSGTLKTLDIDKNGEITHCLYRFEKDNLILAVPNGFLGPRPEDLSSPMGDQSKFVFTLAPVAAEKAATDAASIKAAKLKRDRLQCGANLHRLVSAMHAYIEKHDHFPLPATINPAREPLLSWRVALLPYLGEKELYDQFRQDEPWDSVHNFKLIAKMPKIYANISDPTNRELETYYQVFVGEGSIFEKGKKVGIKDITDGTSNTLAVIAAGEAVPWTKPADLAFDVGRPLPSLAGGMINDGLVSFAFADGSVYQARNTIDDEILRPFIMRNLGDIKEIGKLKK
jgi:RNA polymerase sigma factor (sigma-70 family)